MRRHLRLATALLAFSTMIGGCSMTENPYESKTVKGDEAVELIDSMRPAGSFEAARARLDGLAAVIADRVVDAVPGQTWRFFDGPNGLEITRAGLPCEKLTGDIARRPLSDGVVFGRTFSSAEFTVAVGIVRDEAAKVGATDESSLFDDEAKRDYNIAGNGYEFEIGQVNTATLNITGGCHLMQAVIDIPAGQAPPEPPIVKTTPSP